MPNYEYECCDCPNQFEVFQKMTEEHLKHCPKCQGKVRRLVGTGSGVIYKGSGFYTTEYRSESYKKREKEDQGTKTTPAPTEKKTAETKTTEVKAEVKTEVKAKEK
ncbi:MAG: zinc ribbon domain-containing protein [Candidatus Omnitrophica bacterium]|nr:zinc ribbon domain-containing protein [Candidatus Omnitrophota bacterium]